MATEEDFVKAKLVEIDFSDLPEASESSHCDPSRIPELPSIDAAESARLDAILDKVDQEAAVSDHQQKKGIPGPPLNLSKIETDVLDAIRNVIVSGCLSDIDIVAMGHVRGVVVKEGKAIVDLFVNPSGCPVGPKEVGEVREEIQKVEGVRETEIVLYASGWTPEDMSHETRETLEVY